MFLALGRQAGPREDVCDVRELTVPHSSGGRGSVTCPLLKANPSTQASVEGGGISSRPPLSSRTFVLFHTRPSVQEGHGGAPDTPALCPDPLGPLPKPGPVFPGRALTPAPAPGLARAPCCVLSRVCIVSLRGTRASASTLG